MAGMLNDMVGAAGCDGGGNAMAAAMNKVGGDMRMHPMEMARPGMAEEDELAMGPQGQDWSAEFHQQMMMAPPPPGDWTAEFARMPDPGASWAAEFQHAQHAQQAQSSGWVEEFVEDEVQTFGVQGEADATYEEKLAACRSKGHEEMGRVGNTSWAEEFDADKDWVSQYFSNQGQAEDWAAQFNEVGGDDWMQQYKEMLGTDTEGLANPFRSERDYQFEEDNPYMFHEDPFKEGIELRAAGCLAQAVLAFEATVRKDETHFEGWKQLGLTQADNEKEKLAIAALLRAKALSPHDPDVLMQLGVSLTNEGHRDEATDTFREWIASHPTHGEFASKALAVVGMADGVKNLDTPNMTDYFVQQDEETARVIKVYEHVLQQAPDPELHSALGVLHHMARDFQAAARHYKQMLQFPEKSQDSKLWNRLGAILSNGGEQQEALQAYSRALDLNPGFVRAYHNIGVSHSQLGDHQAAAAAFIKALEIQNDGSSSSPNRINAGMYLWDSLRRSFSAMGRQDLYDLTWKGEVSLLSNFQNEPLPDPLQQS